MKKHLCILICFKNYEHIISTFNGLKNDFTDFIIIENFSDNTKLIKEFFTNQDILKYILFEENIANNAMNIFLNDFFNVLTEYEYITISDCDLLIENPLSVFDEIFKILDIPQIGICCVDLDMKNLPEIPEAKNWIPSAKIITENYIEADTGVHLMTLKKENLNLIKNVNFLDSNLVQKVKMNNKKWVKTKINKAIHLTWDLYVPGNPYYEFKKNKNIWNNNNTCKYSIIK